METIILSVLLGVAIIALGSVSLTQIITGSKERRELQKLLKARDLPEFTAFAEPQEDDIEDVSNLVDLENMDLVIQEALDKNAKFDK